MPHGALKVGVGFGEAIPAFGMSLYYTYILNDGIDFDPPSDPAVEGFLWIAFFTIVISILDLVFICKPIQCMAYTFFVANPLNILGLIVYCFMGGQDFYVPLLAALFKIGSLIFGIFLWKKVKEDLERPPLLFPIYAAQPVSSHGQPNYAPNYVPAYQPLPQNNIIQQEPGSPFWSSKHNSTSNGSNIGKH